jgi:MYXO-CTERM domain-containing protein
VTSGKPAAPAPAAATKPSPAAIGQHGSGGSAPTAVIVVAAAALALLVATLLLLLRRRRRGRNAEPSSAPEAPSPPQPSPSVAPAPTVGTGHSLAARKSERVVAYTTGRNPRELRHQAETIERACTEHGWTLAQVVRERRNGNGHRPGLRFALEQLAGGAGTRLVACRVGDVGRNRQELSALLGWCARSGVDLVALDVGLDTGTRNGKLIARSLVAPGKRARVGRTLRRRRGKAPGVDGELAAS